MAKLVKQYKGFKIKETTTRDNTSYKYQVFTKDNTYEPEWECDNLNECLKFIDTY